RRRHTRFSRDWSSDVCSSDLLKERVGGRLRFFLCGAAPLNAEIGQLFYAMDMLILEAYGLTETSSAMCMNTPETFKFGTVGVPRSEERRVGKEGRCGGGTEQM